MQLACLAGEVHKKQLIDVPGVGAPQAHLSFHAVRVRATLSLQVPWLTGI